MKSPRDFPPSPVECPFLDRPCPQGDLQGMQCQFRVAQDFDPVAHFHDFEIVYCALCKKEIRVLRAISFPRDGCGLRPHP